MVPTRRVTRKLADPNLPPASRPALTELQIEAIRVPGQATATLLGTPDSLAFAGRPSSHSRNDPDLARMVNDRLSSDRAGRV